MIPIIPFSHPETYLFYLPSPSPINPNKQGLPPAVRHPPNARGRLGILRFLSRLFPEIVLPAPSRHVHSFVWPISRMGGMGIVYNTQ